MPIIVHPNTQTFHLTNQTISYIFAVAPDGQLEHLYLGAKLHDREDYAYLTRRQLLGEQTASAFDQAVSPENQLFEYPEFGSGDMRLPAYQIQQENGSHISQFRYVDYQLTAGKPVLAGLPATYVDDPSEANTLTVHLRDELIATDLFLSYTLYENRPVITRSARFESQATTPLTLTEATSLTVDLPEQDYTMTTLVGAWAKERQINRHPLTTGIHSIGSMRGHSSAQYNPFVALAEPTATEHSGNVLGVTLLYSGNFQASVEADPYGGTRVKFGIHPHQFACRLDLEHRFQTPEAVMVIAQNGYNQMSQTFHQLFEQRLVRGPWRQKPRPILLNNWEGTYFDFNEDKLVALAEAGQKVGVELFVLDDGWFGKRDNDWAGLGDWQANLAKLPHGIKGLAERINALGMQFGLWFEPEMVNPDSDLYRAHPDWVLATPNREMSLSRHQYVLDFSKPEVVQAIGDQMLAVLDAANISYVKWDMNRSLTEVFSQGGAAADQGMVSHRYVLGVYALYERLRTAHPEILFESCASGGARFDASMLYYAPQAWTSDDTDAMERLKIQYGTSMLYPISSMGSHVSAVPNQQLGRTTPLATRAAVAYFGTFGYELDLTHLPEQELAELSRQVAFMKQHRQLLQFGTFYRLRSPFTGEHTSWMVVAKDQQSAIVGDYTRIGVVDPRTSALKLVGLDPDTNYRVNGKDAYYGSELMNAGIPITPLINAEHPADFSARVWVLERDSARLGGEH